MVQLNILLKDLQTRVSTVGPEHHKAQSMQFLKSLPEGIQVDMDFYGTNTTFSVGLIYSSIPYGPQSEVPELS